MWNESAFSFSLPKDVGSGNSYTKSLDPQADFKKYGVKIVNKSDGFPR